MTVFRRRVPLKASLVERQRHTTKPTYWSLPRHRHAPQSHGRDPQLEPRLRSRARTRDHQIQQRAGNAILSASAIAPPTFVFCVGVPRTAPLFTKRAPSAAGIRVRPKMSIAGYASSDSLGTISLCSQSSAGEFTSSCVGERKEARLDLACITTASLSQSSSVCLCSVSAVQYRQSH